MLLLVLAPAPAAAIGRAHFPVLSLGNRGADVVALQQLLLHAGARVEPSGFFDGHTRDVLADFQRANRLGDDGVARPATWLALVPDLELGSTGEAVRALKGLLNAKRQAGLPDTALLDEPTALALRAFQKRIGLRQSGNADAASWRHLLWYYVRPELDGRLCGYELHAGRSAKWGSSTAVAQVTAAAELFHRRTGLRVAVGDISSELGGTIAGHRTHRLGLDVDIRAARSDGRGCRAGIAWTMRSYDRQLTRELIAAVHETAPGHVKLIYFNDPVLVREGLTRRFPNHDAHLHIRYCEADHPSAAYRCPGAAKQDAAALVDPLARSAADGRTGSAVVLAIDGVPPAAGGGVLMAGFAVAADPAGSWLGRCWNGGCTWAI